MLPFNQAGTGLTKTVPLGLRILQWEKQNVSRTASFPRPLGPFLGAHGKHWGNHQADNWGKLKTMKGAGMAPW
jgi:hypothetical protein